MLNATIIDNIDDNVELEFDQPNITLTMNMIERGIAPRCDPIQFFVEHFSTSSSKTKQILQDNFISLIAILAFDDVSTNCERQREMVLFQHMTISVDSIMSNYKMKEYAQEKV